jgi:hypothetical protein
MPSYLRTRTISRGTDATTGTDGTAFARPTTVKARICRILLAAEGYVGMGDAASPPTAADTNTVYQGIGTTDYYLDDTPFPAYVYVYGVSGDIVAKVSWLG